MYHTLRYNYNRFTMRKIIIACVLFCFSNHTFTQEKGVRPYTAIELKHWSIICEGIQKTLPSSFKDYTVKSDNCGAFEWAETNNLHQPLTVENMKGEPIGNHPNFSIWFTKTEDSTTAENNRMLLLLNEAIDPKNGIDQEKYTAASILESKTNACQVLSIHVTTNVRTDFNKQYYIGTIPDNIALPIKAFTKLYQFPDGKAVLNENGGMESGTDAQAFYQDKALIIISAVAPKSTIKIKAAGKQTWNEAQIIPQDDAPSSIISPLKNIAIEISGSKQDVLTVIKQIDWKALSTLIGK